MLFSLPGERLAPALPPQDHAGACRITHGPNDSYFENLAGKRVASVRRCLVSVFSIPDEAEPWVGGVVVGAEYRLRAGDSLEFLVRRGLKASLPTNEHGTVVITDGVPDGLVHVDLPRLGLTCKRLGIEYAKAIVDWCEVGPRRSRKRYPVISGVVIQTTDLPKLRQALAAMAQKRQQQVDGLAVLAALFTLNRRAKRCRDLAQRYYQKRMFGFATKLKEEKETIYGLKGQVLHHMVEAGVLVGGKYHRFTGGNWAEVLHGGGYTFHRPCPPQAGDTAVDEIESIEAKPKGAKEPSLEVAFEAVEAFLEGKERAVVYQWPPVQRQTRNREARDVEDEDDVLLDDDDSG